MVAACTPCDTQTALLASWAASWLQQRWAPSREGAPPLLAHLWEGRWARWGELSMQGAVLGQVFLHRTTWWCSRSGPGWQQFAWLCCSLSDVVWLVYSTLSFKTAKSGWFASFSTQIQNMPRTNICSWLLLLAVILTNPEPAVDHVNDHIQAVLNGTSWASFHIACTETTWSAPCHASTDATF